MRERGQLHCHLRIGLPDAGLVAEPVTFQAQRAEVTHLVHPPPPGDRVSLSGTFP